MLINESSDMQYYIDSIEQRRNEIERFHTAMNDSFMDDIIKPFCTKYGLSFKSYNGTWIFMAKSGKTIHHRHHDTTFWERYTEIEDMIQEIDDETKFSGAGYWFENENFEQPELFDEMR